MELIVLVVPDCPHSTLLHERLDLALEQLPETTVTWHEVTDAEEAERLGMHGSPTLLMDGVDPQARPGETASLSCRLGDVPSVDQIRALLTKATRT